MKKISDVKYLSGYCFVSILFVFCFHTISLLGCGEGRFLEQFFVGDTRSLEERVASYGTLETPEGIRSARDLLKVWAPDTKEQKQQAKALIAELDELIASTGGGSGGGNQIDEFVARYRQNEKVTLLLNKLREGESLNGEEIQAALEAISDLGDQQTLITVLVTTITADAVISESIDDFTVIYQEVSEHLQNASTQEIKKAIEQQLIRLEMHFPEVVIKLAGIDVADDLLLQIHNPPDVDSRIDGLAEAIENLVEQDVMGVNARIVLRFRELQKLLKFKKRLLEDQHLTRETLRDLMNDAKKPFFARGVTESLNKSKLTKGYRDLLKERLQSRKTDVEKDQGQLARVPTDASDLEFAVTVTGGTEVPLDMVTIREATMNESELVWLDHKLELLEAGLVSYEDLSTEPVDLLRRSLNGEVAEFHYEPFPQLAKSQLDILASHQFVSRQGIKTELTDLPWTHRELVSNLEAEITAANGCDYIWHVAVNLKLLALADAIGKVLGYDGANVDSNTTAILDDHEASILRNPNSPLTDYENIIHRHSVGRSSGSNVSPEDMFKRVLNSVREPKQMNQFFLHFSLKGDLSLSDLNASIATGNWIVGLSYGGNWQGGSVIADGAAMSPIDFASHDIFHGDFNHKAFSTNSESISLFPPFEAAQYLESKIAEDQSATASHLSLQQQTDVRFFQFFLSHEGGGDAWVDLMATLQSRNKDFGQVQETDDEFIEGTTLTFLDSEEFKILFDEAPQDGGLFKNIWSEGTQPPKDLADLQARFRHYLDVMQDYFVPKVLADEPQDPSRSYSYTKDQKIAFYQALRVGAGDANRIKESLENKPDLLNTYLVVSTPLGIAIKQGSLANILIAAGADVNLVDHNGNTPLHLAIREHNVDIVAALIMSGAEIDIVNGDNNKAVDLLKNDRSLLDWLDGTNEDGQTPLMQAVAARSLDLVKRLFSLGATDIDERALDYITAYLKDNPDDYEAQQIETFLQMFP